jgi:hypothetical protein
MKKIKIKNAIKQKEYNLIAAHLNPVHNRNVDYEYIQKTNSFINKIIGGPIDVAQVSRMYEKSPNSVIFFRDHPLSEQKLDMERDPEGTGIRHANEMAGHYERMKKEAKDRGLAYPTKDQVILTGINEPELDCGFHRTQENYSQWLEETKRRAEIVDIYTAAFLNRLTEIGFIGGGLNLSVGWPANIKENEPSFWGFFDRTRRAMEGGGHYLVLHEYWSDKGPDHMWGWWAGRFAHNTWNVPIIIGEAGIDQYVVQYLDDKESRGYKGRPISHEEYVRQILRYLQLCSDDKRIVSVMIYTSDCNHKDWGSFDLEVIYHLLDSIINSVKVQPGNIKYGGNEISLPVIITPPDTSETIDTNKKFVVASILNVRNGPGIYYDVVDQLGLNTAVQPLETSLTDQLWVRIGNDKWVSGEWLADKPFSPQKPILEGAIVNHHLKNFARILRVDIKILKAIFAVESGGESHGKDGRPIIRFENHIFNNLLNNPGDYSKYFRHGTPSTSGHQFNDDGTWKDFHGNQELEWKALNLARTIDNEIALRSASYGIGQIMGFNYEKLGYGSAQEMLDAFSETGEHGIENQLYGFFSFINNNPVLLQAIKEMNWNTIASIYNGPGNVPTYSLLLRNTYNSMHYTYNVDI